MSSTHNRRRRRIRSASSVDVQVAAPEPGKPAHEFVERLLLATLDVARRRPEVAPMDVLTALCRVTAFCGAEMQAPSDEVLAAISTHFSRELAAQEKLPHAD